MAGGLPPPPTKAADGGFAWTSWYNQLYKMLSTTGSVAWSLIDKAGSSIADLANKNHNLLTSMQGGTTNEYYHLSNVDYLSVHDKQRGVFHDTTTQTAAAINTAYPITFNATDLSNGVSRGTPTSRIICARAGTYNFQFSLQLNKTSAAAKNVWIWARINGSDVANSATEVTLVGNNAAAVAAWNFVFTMAANDYFELVWSTDDTACQIVSIASAAPVPAIPSVILTVTDNI